MQIKFLKITLIVFIIMLFVLAINVSATEDLINSESDIIATNTGDEEISNSNNEEETDSENIDNEITDTEVADDEATEEVEQEVSNEIDNQTSDDEVTNDVGSTKPVNKTNYGTTQYTGQPSSTYSTVASIPEANLSLNNILNVILIAVGVIIILLAIAIFIRLK